MSSTTQSVIQNSAEQAFGAAAVTGYRGRIETVARDIDANPSEFEAILRRNMPFGTPLPQSLRDAVSAHLGSQPSAEADETPVPYLTAEQVDLILTAAGDYRSQAEGILAETGLIEPTPEPEPEPETETDLASAYAGLKSAVESLVAFARRHGFTG